jgi:TM2 domain-containing membrane protein YozV
MPQCRNCKSRISKLDKDICPFCGTVRPLIGVSSETVDITKTIQTLPDDYELARSKSRKTAALLCGFLGLFGAHAFYLQKPKEGLLYLLFTTTFIGGLGTIVFFTLMQYSIWAFLIPFFAEQIFMIILAFTYRFRDDLKDGKGDFLR